MDQSNLLENMLEFNNKTRPEKKKIKEKNFFCSIKALHEGWELTLNAFKRGIYFQQKQKKGKGHPSDLATQLKMSTRKQTLQRLPILHK